MRTRQCNLGSAREELRQLAHDRPAVLATTFSVNGAIIETVPAFKYLGRWLRYDDDDLLAVLQNIEGARKRWFQMKKLLARQHASIRAMGRFYLAAVQSILLYGSETWTLTKRQIHLLDTFHHHCARHITQQHIRPLPDGTWITPASKDVLEMAGLKTISTYIQQCREHITKFTRNLPVYTKSIATKSTRLTATHTYWWLQPNDILHPPPGTTTTPHTYPTNTRRRYTPIMTNYQYQYHNRATSRSHTVLLNDPTHPLYHINYQASRSATTTSSINHNNSPTTEPPTIDTQTMTHTLTHPSSSSSYSSIASIRTYDHDLIPHPFTNTDMPARRLLEPELLEPELPLPPPPIYNYPRRTPPKPPSIAPPTRITITTTQETPLPDSYDSDDFFLPDADDSSYDTDSFTTDSDSESLTSNMSFPTLPPYDDMDDLDELNFSDLEDEDDPSRGHTSATGPTPPMAILQLRDDKRYPRLSYCTKYHRK